jgi:large subunit ribosomal protein L17
MRHQKAHRKLGRTTAHRISMLRNLATSLINSRDEQIVTTLPKAKELRPFVEKAITLSRNAQGLNGDEGKVKAVHLRRQAAAYFHAGNTQHVATNGKRGQATAPRTAGVAALKRLFDELGERYKDRPGGYTRILKLGRREGDNAETAIIELVGNPRELAAAESSSKKKAPASAKKGAKASDAAAPKARATRTKKKDSGEAAAEGSVEASKPKGGRQAKKTESTANEQKAD